jgi:dolichol-phosphate mannosyltransferase
MTASALAAADGLAPAQLNAAAPRAMLAHVAGTPPRLAIVVPCFNEAESLEKLAAGLAQLRAALIAEYSAELIFVDDGSSDGTWDLLHAVFAQQPGVRFVRHSVNRGIAAAIQTGIRAAEAEIVASLDADCTYDPLQIVALLKMLADDVDLVVASPYHPLGRALGVPGWRLALSKTASRLYRLVMCNPLHTYTSCVRVYRRSAVNDISVSNGRFVGIVELLWHVDRRGGRIVECPATLTIRTTGQSKMRTARTALAHLRFLTRAAFARLCGGSNTRSALSRVARVGDSSRVVIPVL